MEILPRQSRQELLDFMPRITLSLQEWQLVEIRLANDSAGALTIPNVAERVQALFKDKEGKLYICNDHEVLMLLRWGKDRPPAEIAGSIEAHLPEGSCKVHVHPPTPEGLAKIEVLVTHKRPESTPLAFADTRTTRRENVILVADDDMYMRMLVKKGVAAQATVHEVANGNEVVAAYRQRAPDIVFLDIHMPGKDGMAVLREILAIDPKAYIVMLSADSSVENIGYTLHEGAKGFLTKPFTKEKLLEAIQKCSTLS